MKTSSKWIIGIAVALAMVAGGGVIAAALTEPDNVVVDPGTPDPGQKPTTTAGPEPTVPDGEITGYVSVDMDNPGVFTIDEVEILTGQEAHDAAVDAGVITADEDLPNDMWIDNPDTETITVPLARDATIAMISATTPDEHVVITFADLVALNEDTYTGEPIYGVVAGQPVLMTITIAGGEAATATAVYQP